MFSTEIKICGLTRLEDVIAVNRFGADYAGFVFYNLKKVKFMHFVGNLLMLIASIYLFFSLFFIGA